MAHTSPSGSPAPNRQRLSADERRERILAAACGEFAQHGYHGASTASIARAAECSEAMLYKHFAGKQVLFVAAFQMAHARTRAQFEHQAAHGTGDIIDRAKVYLHAVLTDEQYAQFQQLRMLAILNVDDPAVREVVEEFEESVRARIEDFLAPARTAGTVRDDVTAEYVATIWLGIMLAGAHRSSMHADGFRQVAPHMLQFLDGLRPS